VPNTQGTPFGPNNAATEVYMCGKNQWGLSFDDGPFKFTDGMLDMLKKFNVTASFFVIGGNIVANSSWAESLKKVYQAGHQIGLHSWTHRHMTTQSTADIITEMVWNAAAVYKIISKVPRYFRPAYGDIDDRLRNIIHSFGLRTAMWNIQTDDTLINPLETTTSTGPGYHVSDVISRVQTVITKGSQPGLDFYPQGPPYPGFISLEHETQQIYLDTANLVIPLLKSKGFQFVSIADCDRATMNPAFNPDGGFYLPDDAPFVKLVKGVLGIPVANGGNAPTAATTAATSTRPPSLNGNGLNGGNSAGGSSSTSTSVTNHTVDTDSGMSGQPQQTMGTSASSANSSSSSNSISNNNAAIIGGVIAAIVVLCIAIFIVVYIKRNKSRDNFNLESGSTGKWFKKGQFSSLERKHLMFNKRRSSSGSGSSSSLPDSTPTISTSRKMSEFSLYPFTAIPTTTAESNSTTTGSTTILEPSLTSSTQPNELERFNGEYIGKPQSGLDSIILFSSRGGEESLNREKKLTGLIGLRDPLLE
ncbi:chitin deacetylase, partial [Blyttiomyces sp. JEL0837]